MRRQGVHSRRPGLDVSVYEAAPELKEIGAGVALHPNAMRVLKMIGVEPEVRRLAGRTEWSVTRDGKTARVISRISRAQQAQSFGLAGATIHRADLLDAIAAALPKGSVTLGKRCASVESDGDIATARFEDGSEIEADVIIGADGIHSRVRAALFGPDDPSSRARSATAALFGRTRSRANQQRPTRPSDSVRTARSSCTHCAARN